MAELAVHLVKIPFPSKASNLHSYDIVFSPDPVAACQVLLQDRQVSLPGRSREPAVGREGLEIH